MRDDVARHWKDARQYEAANDTDAAGAAYRALLRADPGLVVPHLRLSRFAQLADDYRLSRWHALEAGRVARTGAIARDAAFVSLRLLAFAEHAEVASLVAALDWSDPEVLKQSALLAQHLWLAGEFTQALRFLDHVAGRVQPSHLLSYTRANVLRALGRLGEATAQYEHALQLSPDYAYAHWSLAYHQRATPADARLERLRRTRARHPAGSLEQAHLAYALFKELDEAGRNDDAWSALCEGAGIMAARVAHDREAEGRRFEDLMQLRVPVSSASPAGDKGDSLAGRFQPLFIVGLPRTGTTLLDRLLGNHPDIVSAGERNDLDAAISEVSNHFSRGGLANAGMPWWCKLDTAAVGRRYIERVAPMAGGHPIVIDKNPQNLFNVGVVLEALPSARVVCLRRNPMDACFSNLKEMFEGGAYAYSYNVETLALHYRRCERLLAHWQAVAPERVLVVDYESLVARPEDTLGAVLDALGLRFHPGMADPMANLAPVSTASSSQVREPLHGRGVGAWRSYAAQLEPLANLLGLPVRAGS